jgi:hypothetical protein
MIEDKSKRKQRLEDGVPLEIIETLLNSVDNYFNRQIAAAVDAKAWDLVFIGVHSAATTIGTGLFSDRPFTAYAQFMKNFVDTDEPGGDFSSIADKLHNWRNVLVHRWLSEHGYTFGFSLEQKEGWRQEDGVTIVNPRLYHEAYQNAFKAGGKVWQWEDILTEDEARAAKTRLLRQYSR